MKRYNRKNFIIPFFLWHFFTVLNPKFAKIKQHYSVLNSKLNILIKYHKTFLQNIDYI